MAPHVEMIRFGRLLNRRVSKGVSVEQMMIAMYEENPHAFYKENVHALLAKKTLKIPEREVVLKYSRKQALAELIGKQRPGKTV